MFILKELVLSLLRNSGGAVSFLLPEIIIQPAVEKQYIPSLPLNVMKIKAIKRYSE
jgi:hypothetical protein